MSLALGIDASEQRLGWACISYDDETPIALGVEDLQQRDGGWIENQVFRAMRDINRQIPPGEMYVVGIEDAYLGPNRMGSLRHAGVIGMVQLAVRVVFGDVTIWPIPADSWRAALGIKGKNRKEKKAATMDWAAEILGGPDGFVEDEADALGIAVACARLTERNEEAA